MEAPLLSAQFNLQTHSRHICGNRNWNVSRTIVGPGVFAGLHDASSAVRVASSCAVQSTKPSQACLRGCSNQVELERESRYRRMMCLTVCSCFVAKTLLAARAQCLDSKLKFLTHACWRHRRHRRERLFLRAGAGGCIETSRYGSIIGFAHQTIYGSDVVPMV